MFDNAYGAHRTPESPWGKRTLKQLKKAPSPVRYHDPAKLPGRSRFVAYLLAFLAIIGVGGVAFAVIALHEEIEPVQETEMRQSSEALVETWEGLKEIGRRE